MAEFVEVGIRKVDHFVKVAQDKGHKIRWDGWDILFFYPHPYASQAAPKRGENVRPVRWGDVWGFETRVAVDSDGLWRIPTRSVKSLRRPGR